LSGDGGDELFGGYNRYFIGRTLWNRVGWVPSGARGLLASAITGVSPAHWNRAFAGVTSLAPRRLRYPDPGEKLHKLALVLGARNPDDLYRRLTSHWQQPDSVVLSTSATTTARNGHSEASLSDFTQRMMYLDLVGYLPDDILVKVDRAAMGVSLETRVPMLDHKVVEFAWRLPLSFKIRGGQGKWLLRQVLYKHVPRELIDRPKKGFDVPIGSWLRGPLRSWAEALMDEGRLQREGFFDAHQIRTRWNEHLSGRRDWQQPLWNILMFQAWLEKETHVSGSLERTHYSAPTTSL
jgi:asparagine synthase (glutamine-hydrolysing)